MKEAMFQPIMERFVKRCTVWSERFMSHAAKEVLVKSVLQALSTHCMGVFKMTQSFCDKYEKLIRDFWWGDENGHWKVHWMPWDRMIRTKRGGGIGFKDMSLFNQALLAKQAWRLIHRPDCLCARILKSKYYPHGDLVDMVFASDASPVWRGIEHGLDLLKAGLVWRIGNGRKVNIQRDNWILRDEGLKPATFIRRSRLRWVNQLMQPDGSGWNKELIHQVFYPFDAEAICSIKLPAFDAEDTLAWHYEKSGNFTVGSAYRLAYSIKYEACLSASRSTNNANDRSIWDIIWKAKVPEKIKIFGWRVATNTLPTKKNKWKRTLEVHSTCNICGNDEEDEFHAVVSCTKSKALRNEMRGIWDLPSEKLFGYTGVDWLQNLLLPCNSETRSKVLLLLWRCWFLRDDCVHNKGKEFIGRSVLFLQQLEIELISCSTTSDTMNGKGVCRQTPQILAGEGHSLVLPGSGATVVADSVHWTAPPAGTVKLNSDASFFSSSGNSYVGAVARDHKGAVIFSLSKRTDCCSSVEEAEARALLAGLQALSVIYRGPLIAETDCSVLACELQPGSICRSAWFPALCDIKMEFLKFQAVQIAHSKRIRNKLAHGLAAHARMARICRWWRKSLMI
ncbi:unnamed protein product [Triticum turgidum subsp. durum]|uniref:RNase H type-1 domain-containing protein n=1 Tax=Triticum turgidum subsp. durum TaxID=4567 RepID=A0A9R0W589_TRITD|nr:unnamed protein product [Triticum turgidum subsp. durum]